MQHWPYSREALASVLEDPAAFVQCPTPKPCFCGDKTLLVLDSQVSFARLLILLSLDEVWIAMKTG